VSIPTDHARPLPDGVLHRCSASNPAFYQAHGATSSGLRWPEEWAKHGDSLTDSLAELAEDMRVAYHHWLIRQGAQQR
jgi:hypothetical protein